MRAVGFFSPGGPEVLQVIDLPEPHAGPGEVRIRVKAAGVNPSDLVTRSGLMHDRYRDVTPPYIPGWDAAGVIDEADPDTGWRPGDDVIAITLPVLHGGGAYAEWIVVPADSVARVPAGVDFVAAATLPMNGLTARHTLDLLNLRSDQILAVTGAAGAYGGYLVQLAKVAGLFVIADAAPADEALLRKLGADIVVPRGDEVADYIRIHFPGGVDALADGAVLGDVVLPAIKDGGAYAALRPGFGEAGRDIVVHRVMVSGCVRDGAKLDELRRLVEDRRITLRVAGVLPAPRAAQAHRLLAAGGLRGRLVLQF